MARGRWSSGWLCALLGHDHKDDVWHDGLDFRSSCRGCGKPMLRDTIDREWRLFDPVADRDERRLSKDAATG